MNGAQIDERLDALNDLRRAGYEEHDIKLTESGHDFIVCLDAMRRLRGEFALDGVPDFPPPSAPHTLLHGPELEHAVAASPQELPVCPTALDGLKRQTVERALASITSTAEREKVRRDLLRAGSPPSDDLVNQTQTVGVLNGVLTFGISVGLGIAAVQAGGAQ